MHMKKQAGFSVIDITLTVALAAAIVAVGYIAYQNFQGTPAASALPFLPVATKSYTDPAGVYSLQYPAKWSVSAMPSMMESGSMLQTADSMATVINPPHKTSGVITVNVYDAAPSLASYETQVKQAATQGTVTFTNTMVGSMPAFIEHQDVAGVTTENYSVGSGSYIVTFTMTLTTGKPELINNMSYLHQFTDIARSIKFLK